MSKIHTVVYVHCWYRNIVELKGGNRNQRLKEATNVINI